MPDFLAGNTKIYYEEHGDKNSPDKIAFLNGVMASVGSWEQIYPAFVKLGFHVVLHDFKGQLRSGKPAGEYTFAEHAEEARALFQSLGIERVHLVGTSYGGEVAMKYAILFPESALSVSIIDSVSELDPVLAAFVAGWKYLCELEDGEKFFKGMAPSIYGPEFMEKNPEFFTDRAKAFRKLPPEYFAGQKILYDTFVSDVEMTAELCKIQCPALVLCGGDDILKKPKFSEIIARNIPNSEYLTIPGSGHVAILEKPAELVSAILGFILKNSRR
ncbi:MAG: alpha/beta hydrolase [Oscillospiraceae bacterium]|nr:alpha/beta hydrolase [Oscillospiraceae bacterium]